MLSRPLFTKLCQILLTTSKYSLFREIFLKIEFSIVHSMNNNVKVLPSYMTTVINLRVFILRVILDTLCTNSSGTCIFLNLLLHGKKLDLAPIRCWSFVVDNSFYSFWGFWFSTQVLFINLGILWSNHYSIPVIGIVWVDYFLTPFTATQSNGCTHACDPPSDWLILFRVYLVIWNSEIYYTTLIIIAPN